MLSERLKISFLVGIISVVIAVIFVRLIYLQVYKHDFYQKHALKQSISTITLHKDRGTIFDAEGDILAKNIYVASIYSYGKDIKDISYVKRVFAKEGLNLSSKTIKRIRKRKGFVWLKRGVDIEKAQRINSLIKKTNFVIHEKRLYPEKFLAANILGFTGIDNQGLYGAELKFDKVLSGKEVKIVALKDSRGKFILTEDKTAYEKPVSKLYLTINGDLQRIAENILLDDIKYFGAKKVIGLAMDVNTGEILFDVTIPTFDPNNYSRYKRSTWKNASTNYLFEPGSIFKPVTFGFLLSKGLNLEKKVDCENGRYKIYNHTIKDVHKYKIITAEEVLVHSSNVGTVKLNKDYSSKEFYNFLKEIGFGEKTGIQGLSEEKGQLRNIKKWSGLSKASISIGQEILITPIQILRYYAAIANGGILYTPQILDKYSGEEKLEKKVSYKRVLDPDVAENLRYLLTKVVTDGTGKNAGLNFIEVAGKTGTAQKFDNKKGSYSKKNYVAAFAGFFPANNPEIAMLIIYDSPKKSIYGGSTAAISFRKIAEQIAIMKKMNIKEIQVADAR
jgi:cell division protein FtsI (penicillin-binding protein 3)